MTSQNKDSIEIPRASTYTCPLCDARSEGNLSEHFVRLHTEKDFEDAVLPKRTGGVINSTAPELCVSERILRW